MIVCLTNWRSKLTCSKFETSTNVWTNSTKHLSIMEIEWCCCPNTLCSILSIDLLKTRCALFMKILMRSCSMKREGLFRSSWRSKWWRLKRRRKMGLLKLKGKIIWRILCFPIGRLSSSPVLNWGRNSEILKR